MYVGVPLACLVLAEARRGHWIPWNWSHRWLWLWAAKWVWESNLSSGRVDSAPNHCDISPVSEYSIFRKLLISELTTHQQIFYFNIYWISIIYIEYSVGWRLYKCLWFWTWNQSCVSHVKGMGQSLVMTYLSLSYPSLWLLPNTGGLLWHIFSTQKIGIAQPGGRRV